MFKHKQKKKLILLSYFVRKQKFIWCLSQKNLYTISYAKPLHMQAIHTNIEKNIFKNATQLMQEDECIHTHHSLIMQGIFFSLWKSHNKMASVMDAIRHVLVLDVGNGGYSEMVPVLDADRQDGPRYGWDRSDESWGSII